MTEKDLAKIEIAILSKKILQTKWYQWKIRKILFNEAKKIAKKYEIDF